MRVYSRRERARRSVTTLVPFFVGALAVLPIPGIHLGSLPLVIVGIVLARRRYLEVQTVEQVEGPCPACGVPSRIAPPPRARLPFTARCPGCGEFVEITEAP